MEAQDVSKELFGQQLPITNLPKTLARMQALLERPELDIPVVRKIEQEMSRVRGQSEAVRGALRFLEDRVAFATIRSTLPREDGVQIGRQTKLKADLHLEACHHCDGRGVAA